MWKEKTSAHPRSRRSEAWKWNCGKKSGFSCRRIQHGDLLEVGRQRQDTSADDTGDPCGTELTLEGGRRLCVFTVYIVGDRRIEYSLPPHPEHVHRDEYQRPDKESDCTEGKRSHLFHAGGLRHEGGSPYHRGKEEERAVPEIVFLCIIHISMILTNLCDLMQGFLSLALV